MPDRPTKSRTPKAKGRKSVRLKSLPATKAATEQVRGGKRTTVKDSHDRHANTDVNY